MKKPVYQMMREYRESTGMTQTHVAKKTGKAAQRISALENGSIRLTADELVDICTNGFGITPANFLTLRSQKMRLTAHNSPMIENSVRELYRKEAKKYMPKTATKASDNEFYKARLAASSCNDRLGSREGASEETGIDRTRLARIELGSLTPYPEEVLLMADTYNAPEIANFYCSRMCPLGKKTVPPAEMRTIDRLTIRIITALGEANEIRDTILEIAEDGKVTPDEKDQVLEVVAALKQIQVTAQELQMWVTKNLMPKKGKSE